jgi:hypothetical protein
MCRSALVGRERLIAVAVPVGRRVPADEHAAHCDPEPVEEPDEADSHQPCPIATERGHGTVKQCSQTDGEDDRHHCDKTLFQERHAPLRQPFHAEDRSTWPPRTGARRPRCRSALLAPQR